MNDDDDKLAGELRRLRESTPPLPDDFAGALMRQVALRAKPRRSFWQALWAPRTITIRLRPAALLTAGALAMSVLLLGLRWLPMHRPAPRNDAQLARVEPTTGVPATVLVRFSLHVGDARHVSLAGDFNGWRSDDIELLRGPDGTWSATVPLARGSWSYSFVVDGKWVSDPTAEAWRDDGFGGRNAVVRIGS